MKHHTTDTVRRAEHIADHEEREHERKIMGSWQYDYPATDLNWPRFWLNAYDQALRELAATPLGDAERGE